MKPWFKRRKNVGFYEILLAKLLLEDEYNCKNYLQVTSEKHFRLLHFFFCNHLSDFFGCSPQKLLIKNRIT